MKVHIPYPATTWRKFKFWTVATIFTLAGIAFIFIIPGLIKYSETDSVNAKARVVSVSEKNGMYYTTVQFTTAEGKLITAESSSSSNFRRATGSEVDIIYTRDNPRDVSFTDDLAMIILVFKVLGWILLVIGGILFILNLISIVFKIKSPENEHTFFWWINFTGGMLGALSFAIPSTFIIPLLKILPEHIRQQAQHTSILLPVFTVAGILVDAAIFFVARWQLRGRPRWQ